MWAAPTMSSVRSRMANDESCGACCRKSWRNRMRNDGVGGPRAFMMKPLMKLVIVVAVVLAGLASVEAKPQRPGRRGVPDASAPAEPPGVAPAEIQRLFDAYALVQAQEQLNISDDKYSQFLARFKALQDIRRKSLQEHTRIVLEL